MTLIYAIVAGITAASGNRLSLQLIHVKEFIVYSFWLWGLGWVPYRDCSTSSQITTKYSTKETWKIDQRDAFARRQFSRIHSKNHARYVTVAFSKLITLLIVQIWPPVTITTITRLKIWKTIFKFYVKLLWRYTFLLHYYTISLFGLLQTSFESTGTFKQSEKKVSKSNPKSYLFRTYSKLKIIQKKVKLNPKNSTFSTGQQMSTQRRHGSKK